MSSSSPSPPSSTPVLHLLLLLVLATAAPLAKAHFGRRYFPRQGTWSTSREFLEVHNNIRNKLNEAPLVWDRDLARYARRWGSRRFFDCNMIHSFGPYGENIFWGGQDHWTPTQAVQSWITETQYYNPDTNTCVPGQMCGHYTQVVWRNTKRVGCSRTRCLNGGLLIFCEYDPPGNYVDENPFGKAFSDVVQPMTVNIPKNVPFIPSGVLPKNVQQRTFSSSSLRVNGTLG